MHQAIRGLSKSQYDLSDQSRDNEIQVAVIDTEIDDGLRDKRENQADDTTCQHG